MITLEIRNIGPLLSVYYIRVSSISSNTNVLSYKYTQAI